MKIVREHIEFKRGEDPYKKLKIGKYLSSDTFMEEYAYEIKNYLSGNPEYADSTEIIMHLENEHRFDLDEYLYADQEEIYYLIDEILKNHSINYNI